MSRAHRAPRAVRGLAVCVFPVLVALYVGAPTADGTPFPWQPAMVDLAVYREAGRTLIQGGDFYALPGALQFLYPPFAAVLAVPLAVVPTALIQALWTTAGALALVAVLHRFGLQGWVLSLVGGGAAYFVAPVAQTLAFGQLGIFLVALVVLDLAPGPRVFRRRLLPEGTLTALAAAIKLTPAIFLVYLLAVRKWRALLSAVIAGAVVTLASAAIVPRASYAFWSRLAHGDTGLGQSIIYYTNQSVMADIVRLFGLGRGAALTGLAASGLVALAGVWVAVLWHRLGDVRMAVALCGVASLLASPVSWLHHFVWVVPLALTLVEQRRPGRTGPRAPTWFLVVGWLFVGWVAAVPFGKLPNGADVELEWTWGQNLLASLTAVLGVTLIAAGIVVAQRLRRPALRPAGPDAVAAPAPLSRPSR